MTVRNHCKAVLKDIQGINDVEFDVNWDSKNKNSIKMTVAGKISCISKDDLWNFVFTIVKTDQQQKMIPVQKTEFEKYIKQHSVRIKNDMKAGEELFVNCEVNVRQEVADAVRRDLEKETERKKLSTGSVETPYLMPEQ